MNARIARTLLGSIALTCVLAMGLPQVAEAADATGAPMSVARAFVAAMNAGDVNAADATFAPGADLTDDFPPHHWTGAHAMRAWAMGFGTLLKTERMSEPHIAVASSKFATVAGTHAYLPLPTEFAFKQNGTVTKEHGILTFVLDRIGTTWKIRSMAWGRIS